MTTLTEYGRLEPIGSGFKGMFAKGWGTFPAGTIAAHRKAQYDLHRSRRDGLMEDARQIDELLAEARAKGCPFMTRSYEIRAKNLLVMIDAAERSMEVYDAAR